MADDDTHNHAHDTLVLTRSVPASCGGSARRIISNINATRESDGLSNQVQPSVEVSTADILQQAFQEASEELEQITVTYENVQNVVGIADVHSQFSRNDELAVTVGDSSNIHINRVNSQNVENGLSISNVTNNVGLVNRQDVNSNNSIVNDKKETSPNLEVTALPLGSEIQNVNSVCSDLVNQIVAVDGTNGVRLINSGDFLSTNNHNVQPYDLQSFIVAIPDVTDGLTDNISFVAPGLSGSSSLVSQLPDGVSVIAQGLSENSSVESLCDVSFTTVPASSIFTTCSASSRHITTISRTTSLPLPVSTSEVFSVVSQSLSGNSQTISVVPRSLAQPISLSLTQATLPDEGLKHIQRFPVSGGLQNVQSLALPTVTAIQQLSGHVILPLEASNAVSNAVQSCSQNQAVPSTLNVTSGLIVDHGGALTVPLTMKDSSSNFSKDVYVVDTSGDVQTVVGSTANTTSSVVRPSVTTKPNVQKLTIASKLDSCQSLNANVKIVQGLSQAAAQTSLQPKSKTAPLGSSENPIQIIQQGNTYHSTQVLTQEQLQQIAHVLQQQQISKASESGSSSVLYNPATNTRIIYRVIYPSELQDKSSNKKDGSVRGGVKRGRGRPRKILSVKKVTQDEPDDETHNQEISQEEKDLKKKHRPRTRSGRISRPPSYMVQDYKRIHHLDFNEDNHDDTDGGYSDFQMSDEESENMNQGPKYLPPGVNTVRPRTHKCSSCDKAYIGQGGLARHYRQYPSHGKLPNPVESGDCEDENSNTSAISNSTTSTGQIASVIDSTKEATVNGKIDGTSKTDPDVPSKGLYGSACTESPTVNLEPVEKPRKRVNVAKIRRQNKLKDVSFI
ncbi:uncharacterized protein LOC143226722 [Tachypleus tridentatus]|uniref:uncharacterized protein LOC143226722 n=1 Tax=Tachypleus tridentatus TaxID=6853 RepID=UPI003FD1B389